jgi:uncharacterized delta-60 repeat protein
LFVCLVVAWMVVVAPETNSLAAPPPSQFPAGSLDPSFGADGKVVTPIGSSFIDGVDDLAIQMDGKILAAGWTHNGSNYDFALARYEPNGMLDTTFDGDGIVTTEIGQKDQQAHGVDIQPDGRIVVAGGNMFEGWVVRYESDGSLDTTFDGDGIASAPMATLASTLQLDGKVVVAGTHSSLFGLARFTSAGALDTSFDSDGFVTVSFADSSNEAYAVLVQADGKILAAGKSGYPNGAFALARLNPDGSLDTSFNEDGKVTTDVTIYGDGIKAVTLDGSNNIVAAGYGFTQAAITRYLPDGTLDSAFGGDGVGLFSWDDPRGSSSADGVAVEPDGQLLAGGSATPLSEPANFAVSRVNPDGSLDESFGKNGVVTTDIRGDRDRAFAMALQQDGKIVLGGETCTGNCDFALARYLPEAVTGSGISSDFDGDGLADLAVGVPWEDDFDDTIDTGGINVLYATATGLAATGNEFWDQETSGSASNGDFDGFGYSSASGDFNGDGFADLAAGAPGKYVGSALHGGAVSVLYGTPIGLASDGSQKWDQDSAGVGETAETDDFFGWSVGTGDFNGDGFDDLAVGVPGETIAGRKSAGAVNVLYGSDTGLTAVGNQVWHQDSIDIGEKAEVSDQFGFALTAADFDGNGHADLAVGVPRENLGKRVDVGLVHAIYGSPGGLTAANDDLWHQDVANINDAAEPYDLFGYALAGGRLNGGVFEDLLVTVAGENLPNKANAGALSVIYGRVSGLSATSDQFWHQNVKGIGDVAETNDEFGLAVAAGDFNGDGYDDAAIGIPGENLGKMRDPGAVAVIYGSAKGLAAYRNQFWHQNSSGIRDFAERDDLFGYSLVAASFGHGSQEDLAVGVPLEKVAGVGYAGAVNVLYGAGAGLSSAGNQWWNQNSIGVLDFAEYDDEFGFGLAQRGAGTSGNEAPRPLARSVGFARD